MNNSSSCQCSNNEKEVAIADWSNPHRSIGVNNTARAGAGVVNGEVSRSTLTNLFHDRHDDSDSVYMDMNSRSTTRVHPTNGGTMMKLVDNNGSVPTTHLKATEPRRRVQEIVARSQPHELFDEFQRQQELGGDELHGDFPDINFDEVLLLAAESRGWIDELDIYERRGCPFLIKNQGMRRNN